MADKLPDNIAAAINLYPTELRSELLACRNLILQTAARHGSIGPITETLKWGQVQTSPFYRQSFRIDDLPERAFIYVAPLGYFELYINGQKIGDEVLAPAVSNFSKRSYIVDHQF